METGGGERTGLNKERKALNGVNFLNVGGMKNSKYRRHSIPYTMTRGMGNSTMMGRSYKFLIEGRRRLDGLGERDKWWRNIWR